MSRVRLAVLGDSIAWGQGAARPEERLPARLVAGLRASGYDVELLVAAVPGARSAGLAAQVDRVLAAESQVAVVVIGANDLTHLVPPADAAADLARAVARLRAAGTEVVVAPAPDLSMVPHVPTALRPVVRAASDDLRARQVRAVEELGGLVADGDHATSRAFASDPALFSADRFHPSSAGYAVIAAALLPVLTTAAARL